MEIIERGRGPELAGTRVTVYRVMDYLDGDYSLSDIAKELCISEEMVRVAISYIEEHRLELDDEYQRILDRVNQPNAVEIEECAAAALDELRRRIMERRAARDSHDRPVRQ